MTVIMCGNADEHPGGYPAVARLSWPDSRFRPTTGCRKHVAWCVREAIDEGVPILVTPITGPAADTRGDRP